MNTISNIKLEKQGNLFILKTKSIKFEQGGLYKTPYFEDIMIAFTDINELPEAYDKLLKEMIRKNE